MKKILLSALATILTLSHCFSQDIITKSTAEDLRAKVIEITTTEIKYKMFDNPNGPVYTILKSDVFMIRYENGFKEIFQATQSPKKASTSSNDLARQARQDANNYYTGRNSGAGWTGATTTLLGPLFGLIPAISCSNA